MKLKNTTRFIFDDVKYTTTLKKVSYFWIAFRSTPIVDIVDTYEYDLKFNIFNYNNLLLII